MPKADMPEPRRALQLPLVPGNGGRQQPASTPSSSPPPASRSGAKQVSSSHAAAPPRVDRKARQPRAGADLAAGSAGLVQMLQGEIVKRDKWLLEKDEQMREQLRSRDEQMRAKDEQMTKLLQAKDEQMTRLLQAKDEQIGGFMAAMSPASRISSAPQHFPASPVPYNPSLLLPSPPPTASPTASNAAAATAEQRRHTRQVHLRAAGQALSEQAPAGGQTTASRGHNADRMIAPPSAQDSAAKAALMSDDDPGGRIDFVDGLLECIGRMISASVSRKDRKELTKRTDALLEDLDTQESAEWLVSVWTEEQAVAVVDASEVLWAAEKTPDMSNGDVASIVSSVLAALEEVVASHVDKAEVLLASMQGGESDQVVAVLEHGLTLLEKLSSASTRKARKPIDELCEQVEHVIDGLDEDGAMEQLASCE
eukprot:COSAG01_NODE_4576_length_4908_cov_594.918486_6_plen_424_part_01